MRRTFLFIVTIVTLAAAGARAGWLDFAKGLVEAPTSAKKTGGTAAVRGLEDEKSSSGEVSDKRNFNDLDALDKKMPSDSEVETFVKEGGLEK